MQTGSDYMDRELGKAWGLLIDELKILARAVASRQERRCVHTPRWFGKWRRSPTTTRPLAALEQLR